MVDEDEFEHDSEPQEDDLTTEDHVHFYQNGRLALTIRGGSDASTSQMWRQIEAHMKKTQFWPNVWFISDHGNAHLMTKPKRERKQSGKSKSKFQAALDAAEKKYGDAGEPYKWVSGGWREHWPAHVKDKLRRMLRAR